MKIGIMTLWGCSNYGQNLQLYALQYFLRSAGHDAFLIRYPLIEYRDERPVYWLKLFLKKALPSFFLRLIYRLKGKRINTKSIKQHPRESFAFYRDPSYLIHLRAIGQFLDTQIKQSERFYASVSDLKDFPPEADVYITGSDQVWNFWGQPLSVAEKETLDAFFLNFGTPETKRVAYAASFGTRTIDRESAKIIKPRIDRFTYVSVREESGVNLCASFGRENAEWVPDPTLLLDKRHYRSLYLESSAVKPDKPYCLVYMIRDNPDFLRKVYPWAGLQNLEVYLITNNGLIQHAFKETFATIPEWLCLVDNADCVITDSYHGSIFSIIFEKPFGIIPFFNCENDIRLNDLFKRFNLRFPLLNYKSFSSSFTTTDEIKSSANILAKIYNKFSIDWFNKILSA